MPTSLRATPAVLVRASDRPRTLTCVLAKNARPLCWGYPQVKSGPDRVKSSTASLLVSVPSRHSAHAYHVVTLPQDAEADGARDAEGPRDTERPATATPEPRGLMRSPVRRTVASTGSTAAGSS